MNLEKMLKDVLIIRNSIRVGNDEIIDEMIRKFYACYITCRHGEGPNDRGVFLNYSVATTVLPLVHDQILSRFEKTRKHKND